MKEIGGYFGLEQLISNEYHTSLVALNLARNALLYLLKAKNISKLYLPYYLCDSVRIMLDQNGCCYEEYRVDESFLPVFDKPLAAHEYINIVNYYGQLDSKKIAELKEKYGNIILDNTHAFYQKPLPGVDTIYSCRKFFGVPDGAYLATEAVLKEELEQDVSQSRMKHILGRFEGTASEYYKEFTDADISLIHEPLKYMSKLTHNIMGAIDYENARVIREENYAFYDEKFKPYNRVKLIKPETAPFAYPLYIDKGPEIRKQFAQMKIYIPTLWPNVVHELPADWLEYDYASNILPLPCDQRYTKQDLERVFRVCEGYLKEA